MRTLVVLAAIVILVLIFRSFSKSSPQFAKQILTRLAIGAAAILFVFLLVTGRMHWIFALLAAAVPFLRRLAPLIRYLPWLSQLYKRHQASQNSHPSGGQQSSVQSRYLKMSLDHATGDMDGEVLQGTFQGQRLSDLPLEKLLLLYQELKVDNDSVALLHTYLDRHHPDWIKQSSDTHSASNATPSDDMSTEEALEILGITENASQEEIVAAHRRLMQKIHPDHGGSTYLAAKINLAKDRLIN